MMTNRAARNRAGWAFAVALSVVAAPAALLALPAPAPVGVDAVRGAVAGWVGSADASVAIREAPLRPRVRHVATPVRRPAALVDRSWHGDTALLEIAKPARAARQADTVPASARIYEIAELDKKPDLTNKSQVQSMLSRYYPRMLQDAGIRGTTVMQYVITPEGRVDPSTIKVISTTHAQFAEASAKVVEQFKFDPGLYHGKPVHVIIQMPITWAPGTPRPAVGSPEGAGSSRISTPALLAIREIVTQRYPDLVGKATGTRKVLLVVVHPDARIEHTSLADGYMDPYTLRDSNLIPGVTGDQIDHVDVMTSPDLGSIAKDLNSVIWVTLRS
jgi:TonB family protein